jgi:predicted ATP-dependent endonuclease of OLD family
MKLDSIQVENYRSIIKTQTLNLYGNFTVILGPNNEGKSNLLRAIVLAMKCLSVFRFPMRPLFQTKEDSFVRFPRDAYEWEDDFPRSLQKGDQDGQTILSLNFELTEKERTAFKAQCGSEINGNLPLEIRVGSRGAQFKVRKPGRGAKSYEKNSNKIAVFVSQNFSFEYIPAIRPEELSLEVVGNLLERELEILSYDKKYKEALKTIDDLHRPIYARLEATVQEQLKKLLPTVRKVKISPSQGPIYRGRFRVPQLIIDDGTETTLEAKGDGIKSLAAISLMRATKAGGKAGSFVVAIEEPESHLHPAATRQLATVLHEMAAEHQVIITTHSPLLVARNKLEANIIVSKSRATPAGSIKAIRDSLGVQVGDNLTQAEYVILVEGKTDIQILNALFANRSQEFSDLLGSGRVVFDDLGGAGNIAYKISSLSQAITTQILITDDDKAGREADKKAEQAGLCEKYRFGLKRPATSFRSTELEDMIDPDLYWNILQSNHGVNLDRTIFLGSQNSWSDRMKITYEAGAKRWSPSIENNMKNTIADLVSKSPDSAVAKQWSSLVNNMISAITALICTRDTSEAKP